MALNWTMINDQGPVPLPEERMLSRESGADVTIRIPNVPPEGEATSGGSGGQARTLKALGNVWVTTQRVSGASLTMSY
jgi:WW domain-binding protein 2